MIARQRDRRSSCGSADCNIWGKIGGGNAAYPAPLTAGYYVQKMGCKYG